PALARRKRRAPNRPTRPASLGSSRLPSSSWPAPGSRTLDGRVKGFQGGAQAEPACAFHCIGRLAKSLAFPADCGKVARGRRFGRRPEKNPELSPARHGTRRAEAQRRTAMHRILGPAVSAALLITGLAFAPAFAQSTPPATPTSSATPKHGGILRVYHR